MEKHLKRSTFKYKKIYLLNIMSKITQYFKYTVFLCKTSYSRLIIYGIYYRYIYIIFIYFDIIVDLSIFANKYQKICTVNYTKNREAI